ncbi:putative uncharacterized protein DDB_G0278921 [Drosophila kikkawai]|uniref:Uncharacterized protein n=1 Tax=Drosophila kikkawai TaxID=30033 RepID=A0A6P4ID29_DROKI|nr:putative uncharacterized protein DDB_G0292292 [Drosophila kikkawai]
MTALENTPKTMSLKLLLLVIFLVPHCHCNAFAENKTRLLFKEIDEVLVKLIVEHTMMYSENQSCFNKLDVLKEDYRSNKYGFAVLKNVLQRYHNLAELLNFGCKKQMNGKISISEKDSYCERLFGCHKIEIQINKRPKLSLRTEAITNDNDNTNENENTNTNANANNNTNTNTNANNNINANQITILVNVVQPSRKPKMTETPPSAIYDSLRRPFDYMHGLISSVLQPTNT